MATLREWVFLCGSHQLRASFRSFFWRDPLENGAI
jgi:hypothetical protein